MKDASRTIRRLLSEQEIAASQALRFRIWSDEESVPLSDTESRRMADHCDAHAYDWGAFDGDDLIASARMTVHGRSSKGTGQRVVRRTRHAAADGKVKSARRSARAQGIARGLDE